MESRKASGPEGPVYLPPMSHTFSLKPLWTSDLMLNPCVGATWVMLSSDNFFRIVVLPALSKPSTNMRASLSERFSFLNNDKRPMLLLLR